MHPQSVLLRCLKGGVRCLPYRGFGIPFSTPVSPAPKRCLQQSCDSHTEENGPNELAGGPLVVPDTHGVGEQKGHGDGAAEAGQVVLW